MSNSPESYISMIHYLAKLTNSSPYNIITKQYNPDNISKYHGYEYYLNGINLGPLVRQSVKGHKELILGIANCPEKGYYPINTKFDKIVFKQLKSHNDFNYSIQILSPYKNSEGNG